jgi:chromosomal replication initiator protein
MFKNGQKVWGEVLSDLKLSVSASNFKTWFSGSYVLDFKSGDNKNLLIIGVKNSFLKEQIEQRYSQTITGILKDKRGLQAEVVFVVSHREVESPVAHNNPLFTGIAQEFFMPTKRSDAINPYNTFKNFVVGQSNNLAYLAAEQVSASPGKVYNPLLIYGPTGVGKTYLLQAVGNGFLNKFEDSKVLYATAEKFTNDYLESLANKTQSAFRNKYRNVHLLLIDDIQFFGGKESTQDEFFHTFNELYLSGRQIVAASDRHPKELGKLKDRLVSRMLGGMCADVGMPDIEMKVAIIKAKCKERGVTVSDDVVYYMAGECTGSAREIEGMLITTLAHMKLSNGKVNLDEIKGAIVKNKKINRHLSVGVVSDAVCKHFRVRVEDVRSSSRQAKLVFTRQVLMFLLRTELDLSLSAVGDVLGGRDHSTVIHGVSKIRNALGKDQGVRDEILRIKSSWEN